MTRKQNTMFSIDSCGTLLCKLLLTVLCRENDNRSVEIWTLESNHMAHKPAEGAQYSNTHTGERLGSVGLWEATTGCATHHISSRTQQSACFAVNSICFCVLIFSVFFLEYFWLTVGWTHRESRTVIPTSSNNMHSGGCGGTMCFVMCVVRVPAPRKGLQGTSLAPTPHCIPSSNSRTWVTACLLPLDEYFWEKSSGIAPILSASSPGTRPGGSDACCVSNKRRGANMSSLNSMYSFTC